MGNFAENLNLGNRFRPPLPETQFHVNYKIFLTVILVFNTVLDMK